MDDQTLIKHIRMSIPDLIALYRFGSQAKGTSHLGSDVDLAVLARNPIPALRRFEISQELATQLHRGVDLVDLRTASTVMRIDRSSRPEAVSIHRTSRPTEHSRCTPMQTMLGSTRNDEKLKGITKHGLIYG